MANIFEELMNHNGSLTESLRPTRVTKESKCNCKKIKANRFRVESVKIFEDADFDQLDAEFAVDVDDNEAKDEVVLVIDPEIPADDEVPEDAAEQLVGDYVYKCPICGANYVCACDAVETEAIEVDEDGVPTECPICGDDADQILVGEIAPVEDVEDTEEEHEMQPMEVEDEEETEEVEEYDDEGEEFKEESEEVLEDSLKKPVRKTETFGRKKVKEDLDVEVKADDDSEVEVKVDPEEEKVEVKVEAEPEISDEVETEVTEFDIEPAEEVTDVEFEEGCNSRRRVKESELSDDVAKYQKWVDYDMKRYGKISGRTQDLLDKAGLEVVKDQYGDYEVTAKYKAEGCKSEGCKEGEDEDKRPMRRRPARKTESHKRVKESADAGLPEGWHKMRPWQEPRFAGLYPTKDGKGPYIFDGPMYLEVTAGLDDRSDGDSYAEIVIEYLEDNKDADIISCSSQDDMVQKMEEVANDLRRKYSKYPVTESKSLVFANRTFDNLMTKLIRENYKGSPKFVMTKVNLKEGKLYINYTVNSEDKSYKGTLVAEGFRKNASKFTLKMKDKGVFTESYTKEPSFVVECKTISGKITPTSVTYDYTRKVNEQLYRIRGKI